MGLHRIMELAHLWLSKASVSTTIAQTGHGSATVCSYFKYFRELVSDALDESDFCIGGPNIVVEIDESKFGKRKHHRGHRVEGVWILGGVERTRERRVFLVKIENRSLETLEDVISKHVYPGSIIYTDLWRSYSQLATNFDYTHFTVNHSKQYVNIIEYDCEDYIVVEKVHTNSIEGTWSGIKRCIPSRNRVKSGVDEHLFEFIWRRVNEKNLWGAFLEALREVVYN